MTETLLLVIFIVAVAFIFDFTNGFHDAANAIATSVATRALTTRQALTMAAVMNFIGAFLGTGVAETIGGGIIHIPDAETAHVGLAIVLGALAGAIIWNLTTWWFGLPSSSSHGLIGGLAGAGLVGALTVHWDVILDKVVIPMVLSPVVGFVLAYLVMKILLAFLANASYKPTMRRFRHLQTISAAAMALGHGLQDAQKTMGVVVLALVAGGYHEPGDSGIPNWVKIGAALAISLGTYSGGQRIMKTLGQKIIDLDPSPGLCSRGSRSRRAVHNRIRVGRSNLHNAHNHLGDHGCGRDEAAFSRALERCRKHRNRLGSHDSRLRHYCRSSDMASPAGYPRLTLAAPVSAVA